MQVRLDTRLIAVMALVSGAGLAAQQPPRPFPQPSTSRPAAQTPAAPAPTDARGTQPAGTQPDTDPNEQTLGVPIYPAAQFLASYDAGRGQRFYLFGSMVPFADLVSYYRAALKTRGDVLFETPPTHQFELARFRDDIMAFPPSVTIKDYTWGGSAGYPNPQPGTQPARFPTVIQIVPIPPGAGR